MRMPFRESKPEQYLIVFMIRYHKISKLTDNLTVLNKFLSINKLPLLICFKNVEFTVRSSQGL